MHFFEHFYKMALCLLILYLGLLVSVYILVEKYNITIKKYLIKIDKQDKHYI